MSSSVQLRVLLAGHSDSLEGPLRAEGFEVHTGRDAPSVLAMARQEVQDVVILDLDELGGDLLALTNGLRSATPWRRPMLVAVGGPDSDADCRQAGIDLLFVKPVEANLVTNFLSRLRTVVEDYESFDPAI